MCCINILVKNEEFKGKDFINIVGFMTTVTGHSFVRNHDGDGVYFSNGVLEKGKNKVNMIRHLKDIRESRFVMTHQRLTTSGKGEEYTHPFDSPEFVLVHNGVMGSYAKGGHSDTHGCFQDFLSKFKERDEDVRQEKVVNAIKDIFDNVYLGSYSIAIYDKVDKCVYYFKNASTSIYAYVSKKDDLLYITTNNDNAEFLTMLEGINFQSLEIENYTIYQIMSENKKVDTFIVGKIEERTWKESEGCGCSSYYNNSKKKNKKGTKKWKKFKEEEYYVLEEGIFPEDNNKDDTDKKSLENLFGKDGKKDDAKAS